MGEAVAARRIAPGVATGDLTATAEDYLKVIYRLTERGGAGSTADVADSLGVRPSSVSTMLRRLAMQGLVRHAPWRGFALTPTGRRAALRVVRRHRVIETYLVQALGYPRDRVHAEAERLEHAASDDLVGRMATALGHPAVDPHGAPIPAHPGARGGAW